MNTEERSGSQRGRGSGRATTRRASGRSGDGQAAGSGREGRAVIKGTTTVTAPPGATIQQAERPEDCTLIIFGTTGDLTHRKLIPALYDIACNDLLPTHFTVLGFGRKPLTDEGMSDLMRDSVDDHYGAEDTQSVACERILTNPRYVRGEFDDPAAYRDLGAELEKIERAYEAPNRIFYLATPPSLFPLIIRQLGDAGLGGRERRGRDGSGRPWTRIIIEKPFGRDLDSARELNQVVRSVFDEDQVFRIDHYLAKETVQNISMLRFANVIFEPVWNRRYVDHIAITAAETLGVESRGPYYEEAGALRDMVQNHLLQLFTMVTMEPPVAFSANAIRDEKVKVLRAVRPFKPEVVPKVAVRGQYTSGVVDQNPVAGYRDEEGVAPDSQVETYAAVKLLVDSWRWEGVPFYLRTGKRLPRQVTEIAIQFKLPPFLLFRQADLSAEDILPDLLVIRIQPDEGVSLRFESKVPGEEMGLQPVQMDFSWGSSLQEQPFTAYQTLLLDCMTGDLTLFNRDDQVEESWRILMPILDAWSASRREIESYVAGSWGPESSVALLAADGRSWRRE